MKRIAVRDIPKYENEILAEDLYIDYKLILAKGTKLKHGIINIIKENYADSFAHLYIEDDNDIDISDELRLKLNIKLKLGITEMLKKYSYKKKADDKELSSIVSNLMNDIFENKDVLYNLDKLMSYEDNLFSHSINSSIIATVLAVKSNLPIGSIANISKGALLHNIGKIYLYERYKGLYDREINKSLTREDMVILQNYPILGYDLLNDICFNIEAQVKKIVLMHNIWQDYLASYNPELDLYRSFPSEYRGKKILADNKDVAVSIVQTAVYYERIVGNVHGTQSIKDKITALEYIRDNQNIRFGEGAKLLYDYISPFGVGDEVRLSTGETALIGKHTNMPLRPIILITSNELNRQKISVNLLDELSTVILGGSNEI